MKLKRHLSGLLASALALFIAGSVFAHDEHKKEGDKAGAQASAVKGKLVPITEKDAAWAAKARKEYPLDTCVASGDKLGSMGKSPEYIYRVEGKPDRLLVFCCNSCEDDFMKEPAKYLAQLDAAAKQKAAK